MKMRFLILSEVKPFILPECLDRWPDIIELDDGPHVQPRPEHWNLTHEEAEYVAFHGRLKNGYGEYLYIPLSMSSQVKVYEVEVSMRSESI